MKPVLKFKSDVWGRIKYLYDTMTTEVSMLGVTDKDDPSLVVDIFVPQQECSQVTTSMDEHDVADWIEDMVEKGYAIEQLGRVWIHTHPGMKANPSGTDNNTFSETFGHYDSAVMFIYGEHSTSATLYLRKWGLMVDMSVEVVFEPRAEWEKDVEKVTTRVWNKPKKSSSHEDYTYTMYGDLDDDDDDKSFPGYVSMWKREELEDYLESWGVSRQDLARMTAEELQRGAKEYRSYEYEISE